MTRVVISYGVCVLCRLARTVSLLDVQTYKLAAGRITTSSQLTLPQMPSVAHSFTMFARYVPNKVGMRLCSDVSRREDSWSNVPDGHNEVVG